ncbi:MAG: efflux RND transporter periplasmic adaptor subunit [Akkermansiaceae bacterium]
MAILVRFLLPLLVLGGGYLGFRSLSEKEEKAVVRRPSRSLTEVEATVLSRSDYRVVLRSQGVVQPHNQTSLTPRVNGRVVKISPKFESGSFFSDGDVLLELDSTDFVAACTAAEARLARAEAALAQEEARAKQALLDWNDLGYTDPPTDLVLRKPQLKEAHANVKAANAELSDATRNLERTKVLAPYAGRVRNRMVGLGQSVSSGTTLGEIFSTDFAEVRLSLSARELTRVSLPNNPDDPPVPVVLQSALNDDSSASWNGAIVRTEGTLDEKSRKLFVIARVDDPFGLKEEIENPLRIGQPVRAELEGSVIPNVFVIPRSTLRRPNEILLVNPEDSTLKRQRISPLWSDLENLVVAEDLKEGWYLVKNRLNSAPNGSPVIVIPPKDPPKAALKEESKPTA